MEKKTKKSKKKAEKVPKKRGRPPIVIDWELVDELCLIQATEEEIAACCKCSIDTLSDKMKKEHGVTFPEYYAEKSAGGKRSLRRRQFATAMNNGPGSTAMQIWLGKQWLKQAEKTESKIDQKNQVEDNRTIFIFPANEMDGET